MNLDNVSVTVETGPSDAGLPEVNSDDNGKVLTVVDGVWNNTELSGSTPFIVDVSWDTTSEKYITSVTETELIQAISDNPYNIFIDFRYKTNKTQPHIIKDVHLSDWGAVSGSWTFVDSSNSFYIETFSIGSLGPQGFGVYYTQYKQITDSNGLTTTTYSAIPDVI